MNDDIEESGANEFTLKEKAIMGAAMTPELAFTAASMGSAGYTAINGINYANQIETGNPELDLATKATVYGGTALASAGAFAFFRTLGTESSNAIDRIARDKRSTSEYFHDTAQGFAETLKNPWKAAREGLTEPNDKVMIYDFASVRDTINGCNTIVVEQGDFEKFLSEYGSEDEDEAGAFAEVYAKFGGTVSDPSDRIVSMEVGGEDVTPEYRDAMSRVVLSLGTDGRNHQLNIGEAGLTELDKYDQSAVYRGVVDSMGEATGLNRLRRTGNNPSINQVEEILERS